MSGAKKYAQVPIINISPLLNESVTSPGCISVVQEIKSALSHDLGFFQITNHGVDEKLIEEAMEQTKKFFALQQEEKNKIHRNLQNSRGYFKLSSELTKQKPDWKEGFDFGDEDQLIHGLDGPNQWPESSPEFTDMMKKYFVEMKKLCFKVVQAISLGLGLSADFIEKNYLKKSFSFMRLNHYPVCPNPTEVLGVGPHTDAGIITLLLQDDVSGLEVFNVDGWLRVEPVKGAIVVNIGDMLQVWTNDVYKANLHRVVANGNQERFSIPFFFNPSPDAVVEPWKCCTTDLNRSIRYRPIDFGQFRFQRAAGDMADYGTEIQIDQYLIN
eukprot:TRINITY_DN2622_c0_g1_i1.p1 TRINITY_DN2622_c0_g1~~TRINITY_DN2622_c0_g1_i1.p1  ORF type:complete len:327 (+),score=73.61 TRINITY_DN2622_c0_g1_i1:142-1122(+)